LTETLCDTCVENDGNEYLDACFVGFSSFPQDKMKIYRRPELPVNTFICGQDQHGQFYSLTKIEK
jgi:hypothetical protein